MKKLANKFCFGVLACMFAAGVFLTGCSKQPTPQPQAQQQQTQPQGSAPATTGGAQAATPAAPQVVLPTGEISLARNFYFVFDGSGSMRGGRLKYAKAAVKEFLSKVPDDVNLGLYVFDYYGDREVLALGNNNRAQFLAEIDKVYADNGTPLGAAINTGVKALVKQREKQLQYGEFRLIVITDGDSSDNLSYGTTAAADNLIPIYTIGLEIGQGHALRQSSVSYRSADNPQDLKKALEEAAAELDVFDPQTFKKK